MPLTIDDLSTAFTLLKYEIIFWVWYYITKSGLKPLMNNLRTVTRLGVDKFTSMFATPQVILGACELANTLRLEAKEENFFKKPKKMKRFFT